VVIGHLTHNGRFGAPAPGNQVDDIAARLARRVDRHTQQRRDDNLKIPPEGGADLIIGLVGSEAAAGLGEGRPRPRMFGLKRPPGVYWWQNLWPDHFARALPARLTAVLEVFV
jgi:hypothetical protein